MTSVPRLFADDTAVLMNADSVQNLQINICKELDEISNWMSINKLIVNPQKSHALIINPSLSEDQSHISIILNSFKINFFVLIYLLRYLDQETAKGPFRSSSQAATFTTSLTTQT